MVAFLRSLLLIISLVGFVAGNFIFEILTETPKCAVPCFINAVQRNNCPITNVTVVADCICSDIGLLSDASTCVQQRCKWSEALLARDVMAYKLCNGYPKENRIYELKQISIIGLCLTVPIVILRCLSRLYSSGKLWWDDITSVTATAFLISMLAMQLQSSQLGFGQHFWDIQEQNALDLYKYFWAGQQFYIVVQVFAKISILILYMRLFQSSRWFQWTVKGSIVFMLLHGSIYLLCCIFQCLPVAAIWDRNIDGKCLNFTAIVYSGAALSVFEDVVLVLLPIPELWGLQLNMKKRAGLMLMFAFGLCATVTSIVRMNYLIKFWNSYDQSWDNVDPVVWSVIEEFSAIICGSLPSCRAIVSAMLPKFWSTLQNTTYISSSLRSRRKATQVPLHVVEHRKKYSMHRVTKELEEIDKLNFRFSRWPTVKRHNGGGRDTLAAVDPLAADDLYCCRLDGCPCAADPKLCRPLSRRSSYVAKAGDPDMVSYQIHSPREVVELSRGNGSFLRPHSLANTLASDLAAADRIGRAVSVMEEEKEEEEDLEPVPPLPSADHIALHYRPSQELLRPPDAAAAAPPLHPPRRPQPAQDMASWPLQDDALSSPTWSLPTSRLGSPRPSSSRPRTGNLEY